MDLSIIIPAKNEELALPHLLKEIRDILSSYPITYEIIVADGNSTDHTRALASRHLDVWVMANPDSAGIGDDVRRALPAVEGDWVTFMTADGSDSVIDLVRMWEKRIGRSCVLGDRWHPAVEVVDYPWFKRMINRTANYLIGWAIGSTYRDFTNTFKLYRTHKLRKLELTCRGFGYGLEMCLKYRDKYLDPLCIIPIGWTQRTRGKAKFNVFSCWSHIQVLWNYWRGDDSSDQEPRSGRLSLTRRPTHHRGPS